MKHRKLVWAAFFALALLALSCASTPGTTERVPVAKERQEIVRVPVLVAETVYLADGGLDRKVVYTLDASKVEVLRRVFTEASRTEPVETLVRELAPGRVVETTRDRDGQLLSRKTIELDAAGRRVRETLDGSRSAKGSVSEWEYDPAGLLLVWRVRDASGTLLATTEYRHADGKLRTARFMAPSGDFEGKMEYEYDAAGRLKSRVLSDAAGAVERAELLMYKDGVLVEERSMKGRATLEQRIVHEIGPEGVPSSSQVYDGSGRLRERRVYEYVLREETRTVVYYE